MGNGIVEERRECVQIPVREEDGNGIEYYKIPNYIIRDFMTKNERDFFFPLLKVVQRMKEKDKTLGCLTISSQVAVNRLIRVNNERVQKFKDNIWARSVDFVIYDANNNKVVCIIELDTAEHNLIIDVADRDFVVSKAFKQCNLPFVHIPALPDGTYTEKYIAGHFKVNGIIDWEWES